MRSRLQPALSANLLDRPPGFSMCFSSELISRHSWRQRPSDFEFADSPSKHDAWIMTLANAEGGIYYVADRLALYRRHSGNSSHFRPGTNIERRLKQFSALLSNPPLSFLETQLRAYLGHAAYFERIAARPDQSKSDIQRYLSLARQYAKGSELISHRILYHASPKKTKLQLLAKAIKANLYYNNQKINRRMLVQDVACFFKGAE